MIRSLLAHYKDRFLFGLILTVGLLLRIYWVVTVDTIPISDFFHYHSGALSLAAGNGYRIYGHISAFEPIGYPAFLSVLYFVFGPYIIVPKIANILLSAAIMVFTYFVGKTAFSKGTALLAMLMLALSPRNISYTSVLGTEIAFTALFVLLNLLLLKKCRNMACSVLIGAITGVLALMKPFMLAYPFVLQAVYLLLYRNILLSLKRLAVTTAVMCLVISPWTIRNYVIFGEFIPVSTNGGYVLYINNNPYANGAWQDPFNIPGSPLTVFKHNSDEFWNEVQVDKSGKKLAVRWIMKNPLEFVKLGFIKLYRTFILADDTYWATGSTSDGSPYKYGSQVYQLLQITYKFTLLLVVLYFILVLATAIKKRKLEYFHRIIFLNLSFFCLIVFIFEGQPRYAFPVLPVFSIMGAHAISFFIENTYKAYTLK